MTRLCLLFILISLTACTAPPPSKDENEIRRPPRDQRTLDALVVDTDGKATWLVDLLLRGASPFYEDDDWYFFEMTTDKGETVTKRFRDLRRVYVGPIVEKTIRITLLPREGAEIVGFVPRRSYLEGRTEFGPMSIKLRDVRQISFGGDRAKSKVEKDNPRPKGQLDGS
jgi:hypothetical protein